MDNILRLFPPHIWQDGTLDVCLGVPATVLKGWEPRAWSFWHTWHFWHAKHGCVLLGESGRCPVLDINNTGFSYQPFKLWATKVSLWAPTRHQPEVMFPLSSVMLFKTEFKTRRIKANFRIFISSLKWVICRKCKLWRLSSRFSCCGLLWLLQSILSYFKKKKKKKNFNRNSSIPFKNQSLKRIQLARKIKSFWHNITGANNRFL